MLRKNQYDGLELNFRWNLVDLSSEVFQLNDGVIPPSKQITIGQRILYI